MNLYEKLLEIKKANIKLQRDTKAFNYKYATLSQIQEKFGDILADQKLLIIHSIVEGKVHTRIVDSENPKDFIGSDIPLSEGIKPQDKGSEITYYRRYNLLSLLDLEVEDDDGKNAQDSLKKQDLIITPDLPWIDNKKIESEDFKKFLADEKSKTLSLRDILIKVRGKYKISKASEGIIENFYNQI
jgi:hypothetical protein